MHNIGKEANSIATDPSINFSPSFYSLTTILFFSKFHLSWLPKTRIFISYYSIIFIESVAPIFPFSIAPIPFVSYIFHKGASSSSLAKWYVFDAALRIILLTIIVFFLPSFHFLENSDNRPLNANIITDSYSYHMVSLYILYYSWIFYISYN